MQRALVIVNPIAGRGAGQRVADALERGLGEMGMAVDVALTRQAGDAQAAAAAANGHDVVIAIGGDGTLNEVINGLEADVAVVPCPLGTANVLAKELRIPRRIRRFCEMVRQGRTRTLDLAAANGRRFVSMAGAGFDASVAAAVHANRSGSIRMRSYVGPIVHHFAHYDFPPLRVRIDGAEPVVSEGFVLVSNVRAYGGPLCITPDARPDDGLLDVCVLPRGSRLRYLRALAAFFFHCPRRYSGARYFRARTVHVSADDAVPYQVDGDAAGHLPAAVEMLDRKLRVVVPCPPEPHA